MPIYPFRCEIVNKVREHPIVILSGSTGCGKVSKYFFFFFLIINLFLQSTQVPQYIYEDCTARGEQCNILVSQPRKIAAITIAQRVAQENGTRIGEEIGYQVALNKVADLSEDLSTAITFCTTGVILAKVIQRKSMASYSHIILDEVHERSKLITSIVEEKLY